MSISPDKGQEVLTNSEQPMSRRKFSFIEDEQLRFYVQNYGTDKWKVIAALMRPRTSRQCRERYKYFLSPDVQNTADFTEEEDITLIKKVEELGSHWSVISSFFLNRSDVSLKNRYRFLIRQQKRVVEQTKRRKTGQNKGSSPLKKCQKINLDNNNETKDGQTNDQQSLESVKVDEVYSIPQLSELNKHYFECNCGDNHENLHETKSRLMVELPFPISLLP